MAIDTSVKLHVEGAKNDNVFNQDKTKRICNDEEMKNQHPEITFVDAAKDLGTPIGSRDGIIRLTNESFKSNWEELEKFQAIFAQRAQTEPNCGVQTYIKTLSDNWVPKNDWIAMTVSREICIGGLQEFHQYLVKLALKALCVDETHLDQRARDMFALQIKLPKKSGGFGIYNAADFVDAHRLSTLMAALPLASTRLTSKVIFPELEQVMQRILELRELPDMLSSWR